MRGGGENPADLDKLPVSIFFSSLAGLAFRFQKPSSFSNFALFGLLPATRAHALQVGQELFHLSRFSLRKKRNASADIIKAR